MQRDDTPARGGSTGPRHAAPRRSLLTKVQAPAGRAIALAAMPSALLFGMGLTPKIALADEPGNPFAPGPCVTQPEDPAEEKDGTPPQEEPADQEPGTGPEPERDDATDTPQEPEAPEPEEPSRPEEPAAPEPERPAEPEPEKPAEPEPDNPWDPLGVGDALKDLFGLGEEPERATAERADAEPGTSSPEDGTPSQEEPAESAPEPAGKPGSAAEEEAAERAEREIRDAAEKAGADVEELPEASPDEESEGAEDAAGAVEAGQESPAPGGKEPFPCPTHDPEALADAELEPGLPLLPDEPWLLESSKLVLRELDYHGIVEVRTAGGAIKKVLKFTSESVDIGDLHQRVTGALGGTTHVEAERGSTSTIRNGTVTMYTEELKGNLFGLIPVTFSPDTPPPLNVPYAVFTDVNVKQAGQFGGTLTIPGMNQYHD
ncbi:hypothetical protein GCM10023347_42990 [Streptomyces chumphonensis]|uniref:Hydrogenase expression protein HypF n=1 Tax=Streptomyces chumphonensis TaxID=1214925 RepID=A0A927ICL5_9ACTN|nr:hypothetical protein [Streptomyces chumphonensis]MBD3934138.1 hypothetical protein [Streptomyces chumphonensis]